MDKVFFVLGVFYMMQFQVQAKAQELMSEVGTPPLQIVPQSQFMAEPQAQRTVQTVTPPPTVQTVTPPPTVQTVTPPPTVQTVTPPPAAQTVPPPLSTTTSQLTAQPPTTAQPLSTTTSQLTPQPQIATRTFKYHGNNFSLKFHRPSCIFAQAMSQNHLRLFPFRFQAIEAGYVPCRYCLPPFTRSVKAIIMEPLNKKTTDALTPSSLPGSPEIHK